MITAIVLYEMPDSITREQCLAHYRKIAPSFLEASGFLWKVHLQHRRQGWRRGLRWKQPKRSSPGHGSTAYGSGTG